MKRRLTILFLLLFLLPALAMMAACAKKNGQTGDFAGSRYGAGRDHTGRNNDGR